VMGEEKECQEGAEPTEGR